MEQIKKYFPELDKTKAQQFEKLQSLYNQWNNKINVISRKDIENFYIHHVLHSLSIAKIIEFKAGTRILDVGTGGGFPGIPLAIMFPECNFTLVDSIGKKILVVKSVSDSLLLENVTAINSRVENITGLYDFIISRAVTRIPEFMIMVANKIDKKTNINTLNNGVLYLKGGDFENELSQLNYQYQIFDISRNFSEGYFGTKKIIHLFQE